MSIVERLSRLLQHISTLPGALVVLGGLAVASFGLGAGLAAWRLPALSSSVLPRTQLQGTPSIRPIPYPAQPTWYDNHQAWLTSEGQGRQKKQLNETFALAEVRFTVSEPTSPCTLIVRVSSEYRIFAATAFRLFRQENVLLFERVNLAHSPPEFRELVINLPRFQFETGYEFVMLVRVERLSVERPIEFDTVVKREFTC